MYATGGMGGVMVGVICGSKEVGRRFQNSIWYALWNIVVRGVAMPVVNEICCLTSHAMLFQLYMWQHLDVQADWGRSLTYGRALNAIDFNVPVQAPTRGQPLYGYSEKPPPPPFIRLLRRKSGIFIQTIIKIWIEWYDYHIIILYVINKQNREITKGYSRWNDFFVRNKIKSKKNIYQGIFYSNLIILSFVFRPLYIIKYIC